jgi:hypothetical protein
MRQTKKTRKKTAAQRKPELVKSSAAYRKWLQLCDSVAKRKKRRKK